MGDEKADSGAAPAPQMPLDLSLFDNEQDYLSASKCNYFLQLALKNKDEIAAKGNRQIAQVVEDTSLIIRQKLDNIEKLQAEEISQATKNLKDLGRSQQEIDSAQAYLESHSCPGIATHKPIKSLVRAFEDKAKSVLENSTTPGVKAVSDKPVALPSAPPTPTPPVVSTDAHQPNQPATAAPTRSVFSAAPNRSVFSGLGSSSYASSPALTGPLYSGSDPSYVGPLYSRGSLYSPGPLFGSSATPAATSKLAQPTATTSSMSTYGVSTPALASSPSQCFTPKPFGAQSAPPSNPPQPTLFGFRPPPAQPATPYLGVQLSASSNTPARPATSGGLFGTGTASFNTPAQPAVSGGLFGAASAPSNTPAQPAVSGGLFGAASAPSNTLAQPAPSGGGALSTAIPSSNSSSKPAPSGSNSIGEALKTSTNSPATQPTKPAANVPQPSIPSTQSATKIKRSSSPEAMGDTKRPRITTIRICQLVPEDRPVQIDDFIYVFRCPDVYVTNKSESDGINPIQEPIKVLRLAARNGDVAFPSANRRFDLMDIALLLAHKGMSLGEMSRKGLTNLV
ncbi:hypothetical protein PG984_011886 [Apiospora sp. TS-2023a]